MISEADIREIADQVPGAVFGEDESTLELPCTKHPGKGLCVRLRLSEDARPEAAGFCGCTPAGLLEMLARQSQTLAGYLGSAKRAQSAKPFTEIQRALKLLCKPDEVYELRALETE